MRQFAARLILGAFVVLAVACLAGSVARAVSQSDTAYYDGFQDLSGLDAARSTDVVLDALGGARLKIIGAPYTDTQFPASGTAVTLPIGPPEGLYLLAWGDLTVDCDIPGGTGVNVSVEDDAGAQVVAPHAVTAGATTIPLTSVAPLGAKLVTVLELTGDGSSTPKLKSLGASYTSTTMPAQMTVAAAKTLLVYGASTTLTGKLFSDPTPLEPDDGNESALVGQVVTVRAHTAGTTGYKSVGTRTTAFDGTFSMVVKPTAVTTYRAEWAGGTFYTVVYPPASAGVRVDVKAKVSIVVSKYNSRRGKYYSYKRGRTVYVTGAVTPNHYKLDDRAIAGRVVVTVYKYKSTKWVMFTSSTRKLGSTSRYSWPWKPSARGTYRLASTFKGDPTHLGATSKLKYVKVY
jgi:hypothetical protein